MFLSNKICFFNIFFFTRLNWETSMPAQQYFRNNVYLPSQDLRVFFPRFPLIRLTLYVSYKCVESYLSVVRNKPEIQQAFTIRRQQPARSRLEMPGTGKKKQMCAPSNNLGLSVSLARDWCKCATYYPIEGENMPAYLSLDIVCSSDLTVFLVLRSRKTVRFSEQLMSAYKYSSTFSCQIEAIVVCLQTWPSASTAYMQYQGRNYSWDYAEKLFDIYYWFYINYSFIVYYGIN